MKKHGENLDAYYYEKEANLKFTYCMTPTIWHSGKGKTVEIQKRNQWLPGVGEGWRDEQAEHRGFSGQWKHSVWYHNDGHVSSCISFCIYSNSQNVQFQGWTLMPAMNFGRLWWVNIGSSIVTYVPLDVDNEAGYAYRKYTGNLCTLPSSSLWLPWWLNGKESACRWGKCRFDPWVLKIPWRRKWQLAPVFLPGICHGQRNCGLQSMRLQRVGHNLASRKQQQNCSEKKSLNKTGAEGKWLFPVPRDLLVWLRHTEISYVLRDLDDAGSLRCLRRALLLLRV